MEWCRKCALHLLIRNDKEAIIHHDLIRDAGKPLLAANWLEEWHVKQSKKKGKKQSKKESKKEEEEEEEEEADGAGGGAGWKTMKSRASPAIGAGGKTRKPRPSAAGRRAATVSSVS
jgi:hypothetical protein